MNNAFKNTAERPNWSESIEQGRHRNLPSVAIKVFHPQYNDELDDEFRIFEAFHAAGVESPHLIKLLDSFQHHGRSCMAFELHGSELAGQLRKGPLPLSTARQVTKQLLSAVAAIHEAGFAHTDLKPENILYSPESVSCKIIDFSTTTAEFRQGKSFGTRGYRAPEVVLGCPWGLGVDIWGIACCVYEMLTGQRLVDGRAARDRVMPLLKESVRNRIRRHLSARKVANHLEQATLEIAEAAHHQASVSFQRAGILRGKYVLAAILGTGHFSTVWQALLLPEDLQLHEEWLDEECDLTSHHSSESSDETSKGSHSSDEESSDDGDPAAEMAAMVYDGFTEFAHFVAMQETIGHFPRKLARDGDYYNGFYNRRNRLKFNMRLENRSISTRLIKDHGFSMDDALEIEAFLSPMLEYNPEKRVTATQCLESSWLNQVR